jgi:hypothetical protein
MLCRPITKHKSNMRRNRRSRKERFTSSLVDPRRYNEVTVRRPEVRKPADTDVVNLVLNGPLTTMTFTPTGSTTVVTLTLALTAMYQQLWDTYRVKNLRIRYVNRTSATADVFAVAHDATLFTGTPTFDQIVAYHDASLKVFTPDAPSIDYVIHNVTSRNGSTLSDDFIDTTGSWQAGAFAMSNSGPTGGTISYMLEWTCEFRGQKNV